ncbi:hypothetical protein AB3A98_003041 [Vibrio parahaemolyticus]
MIRIETHEQAKKLTQAIHTYFMKGKPTLNQFRGEFASLFGYKSLRDPFKSEQSVDITVQDALYKEFVGIVVTPLDDPRITLSVALDYKKDMSDSACLKLIKSLDSVHDISDPKFKEQPTIEEFKERCEELLTIFGYQDDFYDTRHLFKVLFKVSMPAHRIQYERHGNPEREAAKEFLKSISEHIMLEKILEMIKYDEKSDFTPLDAFSSLRSKIEIFISCYIWTSSPVGHHLHKTARDIAGYKS